MVLSFVPQSSSSLPCVRVLIVESFPMTLGSWQRTIHKRPTPSSHRHFLFRQNHRLTTSHAPQIQQADKNAGKRGWQGGPTIE